MRNVTYDDCDFNTYEFIFTSFLFIIPKSDLLGETRTGSEVIGTKTRKKTKRKMVKVRKRSRRKILPLL